MRILSIVYIALTVLSIPCYSSQKPQQKHKKLNTQQYKNSGKKKQNTDVTGYPEAWRSWDCNTLIKHLKNLNDAQTIKQWCNAIQEGIHCDFEDAKPHLPILFTTNMMKEKAQDKKMRTEILCYTEHTGFQKNLQNALHKHITQYTEQQLCTILDNLNTFTTRYSIDFLRAW